MHQNAMIFLFGDKANRNKKWKSQKEKINKKIKKNLKGL